MPSPVLILSFLMVLCFSLATWLQPRWHNIGNRAQTDDMLTIMFGDGRRMFANHFFTKADVYFHSGYYPSFFQQAYRQQAADNKHLMEAHDEDHDHHDEEAHEKAMDFLGQPKDWIDRFGRHFYSSRHSHLDKPGEAREILPWLRISAELDPQRIDTYTVAAYWLREHLGKVDEAEQFLREGLRANPSSYEILFELGRLYSENRHNPALARNLWELAMRRWYEQDDADKEPDIDLFEQIVANLAHLEEEQGNLRDAIAYKEIEVEVSPVPEVIQQQIGELKQKLNAPPMK
jgi:tetratricopeptide (TPR) repeat protein